MRLAAHSIQQASVPPVSEYLPEQAEIASAAEELLASVAPRAISLLTSPRTLDDGREVGPRLSANDCYSALSEACRKMARVVVARRAAAGVRASIPDLFPEPAAYLARAIRSVLTDDARVLRREPLCLSLDAAISSSPDEAGPTLADLISDPSTEGSPEAHLLAMEERNEFRSALRKALRRVPANYIAALTRDIAREKERQAGRRVAPATASERQTLCRARAAVTALVQSECTAENRFVWIMTKQKAPKVRRRPTSTTEWTGDRQAAMIDRLLGVGWANRHDGGSADTVGEAVVNDVTDAQQAAPPSPEVRDAIRVLDLYTVDRNSPKTEPARSLYDEARSLRAEGRVEDALARYRTAYDAEPSFIEALNEVGVMYSRLGRLRDALRVYLLIIERDAEGPHRFIAATNAADIHLTWHDAGRNRERNLELALHYALMAMQRPSPMRVANLILALVKDRRYTEAQQTLEQIIREDMAECRAEKALQTLFQIRDRDLVAWWTWLEGSMGKE